MLLDGQTDTGLQQQWQKGVQKRELFLSHFLSFFFFYTKVQPDAINISVSNNTTFMVITEGDLHGTEKVCFPSLKKVLKTSTKKPNNAKTWVTRTPVKIFIRHKKYRYLLTLLFTVPSLRPH